MESRKRWIVPMLLSGILLLILTSCVLDTDRTVQFYASATIGLTSVSYLTATEYNAFYAPPSPWSVETECEKGDYVILSVSGDGDLIARIYVDGVLWKEKTGTDIPTFGGYLK